MYIIKTPPVIEQGGVFIMDIEIIQTGCIENLFSLMSSIA